MNLDILLCIQDALLVLKPVFIYTVCFWCDLQDVKGPQTVAFNLPNDDRIVKDRGTAMVMLKNISQAK